MKRYILGALVSFGLLWISATEVGAFRRESYVSFNVPVEADVDFERLKKEVDTAVAYATHSASPITFYLEYDVVRQATAAAYFREVLQEYPYHKLGVWSRVTRTLLTDTQSYQGDKSLGKEAKRNMTAYSVSERKALIDQIAGMFLREFGTYPSSVMDDYLDSVSLGYWSERYGAIGGIMMFGELGLKMSVGDGDGPGWYNRYFPYLPSKVNAMYPGDQREGALRLVMTPGFLTTMNPELETDLSAITDKGFNEYTALAVVAPISSLGEDSARWLAIRGKLQDKHTLVWTTYESFANLYLARNPYYTMAMTRKVNRDSKEYFVYFSKDYFAVINLTDRALEHLSVSDDMRSESYWFETNKEEQLSVTVENAVSRVPLGVGVGYTQGMEYWRTWLEQGDSRIDFAPDKISMRPGPQIVSTATRIRVKSSNRETTLEMGGKQNVWVPYLVVAILVFGVYVYKRKQR